MKTYLALWLFLVSAVLADEPLKVGDLVPSFKAKDQHGHEYELSSGVQRMFVSFDMSTGKEANAYFARKGAGLLPNAQAIYVSNIYGMPSIGRVFALPKMRKYPHRIILADSENLLARYPQQKDRITVLSLDANLRITGVAFWNPKEDVPAGLLTPQKN